MQVDLSGRVDPLELLEALQDRDSRPYQLLLRMPNGVHPSRPAIPRPPNPSFPANAHLAEPLVRSAKGARGALKSPALRCAALPCCAPGDAFLGSTPERLFCRSGTAVASEAVAGSRARGTQGSPESDFWLALDLLRNPKVRPACAPAVAGPAATAAHCSSECMSAV